MKVTFVLIIAWALVLAAEAFGSDSAAAKEARAVGRAARVTH